jgi:hypothetical protein
MKTTIKNEIKKLSENQKNLTNQRKTVHIKGERVMEAWQADYQHSENRHELRMLYAAYAVMKGKTFEEIEPKNKPNKLPLSQYKNSIDKLVEKYKVVEEITEESLAL